MMVSFYDSDCNKQSTSANISKRKVPVKIFGKVWEGDFLAETPFYLKTY